MVIHSKIDSDLETVSVTFVSGDISNSVEMTKEEYIKYINGTD